MKTLFGRGVLQCLARFASCAVAKGIFPTAFAATKTWSVHPGYNNFHEPELDMK